MDLGKYVISRLRSSTGLHSVAFEVPKRLRPETWPPTIPLPQEGRIGDLSDPMEVARIKADAAALLEELNRQKSTAGMRNQSRTWRALASLYESSSKYASLKKATKTNYGHYTRRLLEYFDQNPEFQPSTIKESEVETVLASWGSADTRYNQFTMLRVLLQKAVREKWRNDDPTKEIKCKRPSKRDRRAIIWEEDDVDTMLQACTAAGYPSISRLIQTEWEIGQRLTDARLFRFGEEYADGFFRFHQSKTGNRVTIPVSNSLKELLEAHGRPGEYLFLNPKTGLPFTEHLLWQTFDRIRGKVPGYSERTLCLRHLRHSCVVQLARAGCTVPEIASITGHSMNSVHNIIEHYLPRDSILARNAVDRRMRVNAKSHFFGMSSGGHSA